MNHDEIVLAVCDQRKKHTPKLKCGLTNCIPGGLLLCFTASTIGESGKLVGEPPLKRIPCRFIKLAAHLVVCGSLIVLVIHIKMIYVICMRHSG